MKRFREPSCLVAVVFLMASALVLSANESVDRLSFSEGALPIVLEGDAKLLRAGFGEALAVIDGNIEGFVLSKKPFSSESRVAIVYELPAPTTFERFAVPAITETPSPSQTFVREVEVSGSSESAAGPFTLLAKGSLGTHTDLESETELAISGRQTVRWIKVSLSGGIDVRTDKYFVEFSELIGNGVQEPVEPETGFSGAWKHRANVLELRQEGPIVSGCYDDHGELSGTVSGNVLRATGVDKVTKVPSTFLMLLDRDGEIQGVRSTNGAPFSRYVLPVAPKGSDTRCSETPAPSVGCGSVLHGIAFDFDSAALREDSASLLARLYEGLAETEDVKVVIEGHTSSEGTERYNQELSEKRAQSVVADLIKRGFDASQIQAAGKGEAEPIADNGDEAGRSLNRRVEVRCISE